MARARNLLVLLCDQLQADCMSLYGGPVPTPSFERVAERGAVFDRYYCAVPMCAPTRPSMMTGRWAHQHGAICNADARYATVHDDEELLIDRLQDAGYHVGYDGIWHINRRREADRSGEYAHFRQGHFPYRLEDQMLRELGRDPGEQRALVINDNDEGPEDTPISVPAPATWTPGAASHPDMTGAARMARFIREVPEDRPLAAWCSLRGPHPPLVVPDPWMSRFDPAEIERPPGLDEDPSSLPRSVRESPGLQGMIGWGWDAWAEAIAAYYGYVAFVDHCQGLVLDALEQSGRLDDTVIIVSTDHGEMMGWHGIYQKFVMYEQSARVPFIISAPGIEPGRRSHLASQTDMAPTVLDLLGMEPLSRAEGESLVPILDDPNANSRPYTFVEYNGWYKGGYQSRLVAGERYKYVYDHQDFDQLFDLQDDPCELVNLAEDPAHADALAEHRAALTEWMDRTDDFIRPSLDSRKRG